mmetsp:Transcript_20725/g.47027  ORF Transcript_20725/g.47027 Transcript_20725/m.47027 type:complete len:133 (+) Transcript_20725:452-850(+)
MVLREELDHWHSAERAAIDTVILEHSSSPPPISKHQHQTFLLADLLSREVAILREIDVKRAEAIHIAEKRKIDQEFGIMAAPLRWEVGSGTGTRKMIEVRTPEIDRAYRVRTIYYNLMREPVNSKLLWKKRH